MEADLDAYRERLAEKLAWIDMRAIPGFGTGGAPMCLDLGATMVLPRLHGLRDEAAKPQAVGRVLAERPAVVVHGEPGSGKTTLLSYLCLAYARTAGALLDRLADGTSKEFPLICGLVPVLLRLAGARFKRGTAREFSAFVRDQLTDFSKGTVAAVMQALADGRGLVCVDGLDEIGDDAARRRAARALEAWTLLHANRCWVTTRKHGALTLIDSFAPYQLVPFGRDEIHEYLRRRPGSWTTAWLHRLEASPRLLELVGQPLLLVLALAVEDDDRRLPVDRVFLYERAITALVRDWNAERRLDALLRPSGEVVDADEILRALAAAALHLHEQRRLAQPVARAELHRLLAIELGHPSRADGALEVFMGQAGLLVAAGDKLRFWHTSFGEFLAAKGLAHAVRDRPVRLLRVASTATGREVVCMAIAWLRTLGGDPALASRLFHELLADAAGGPWARLFGAHVRLAVDVVRDGHALSHDEFSQVVARVLSLVERSPLWGNAELLAELVAACPDFACPPMLVVRIVALIRRPSALPDHVAAAAMRWLAGVARDSAEARACCEDELVRRDDRRREWAAIGLLRAGAVRDQVVLAVVEPLALRMMSTGAPEVELAEALAPVRASLLPALRRFWADHPAPSGPPSDGDSRDPAWHLRHSFAVLRALLADDDVEVFAALFASICADRYGRDASNVALRWLIARGDAAQRQIADALVDADLRVTYAAAEVLRAMLLREDQAVIAADVVVDALQRAPGRLPSALEVLSARPGDSASRKERPVLSALRRLVEADRGEFPHALVDHWSRLVDDDGGLRWLLAALMWPAWYVRDPGEFEALAGALYSAVIGADLEVAVVSACLLDERWEHLSHVTRQTLLQTWIRGLQRESVRDDAWSRLSRRAKEFDNDARARLRTTMDGLDAFAATIASLLLLRDPVDNSRSRSVLLQSLASADLSLAELALEGLKHDPAVREAELLEQWFATSIRLALAGLGHTVAGAHPPSLALVKLYLGAPWNADAQHIAMHQIEDWLAQHPDTLELALSAFTEAAPPEPRAVGLLAAWLDAPGRVEALIDRVRSAGEARIAGALAAVRHRCRFTAWDTPLHAALRSALHGLLRDDLHAEDLALVSRAMRILEDQYVFADDLPAVRGRLLDAGTPASKRTMIRRWVGAECPPAEREEFARRYFQRSVASVIDALRTCFDETPTAALEAGLLLRRLGGAIEPLRARCWAILAAPNGAPIDGDLRLGWLLERQGSHELRRSLGRDRLRSPRAWALLVLEDLGDDIGEIAVRELLGEPEAGVSSWWLEGLLAQRPDWAIRAEPWILEFIARAKLSQVVEVMRRLRERTEWTPAITSALSRRWPEWLEQQPGDVDASLAAFVGAPATPDRLLLDVWRAQLASPDLELCARSALALAGSVPLDATIFDALIGVYLSCRWPPCQRAGMYLRRPEHVALLVVCRRARATRCLTPEESSEVLMLWASSTDCASERELTLSLLEVASRHENPYTAFSEALWLADLDNDAGVAAIVELAHRSTQAAVWLLQRGESCPAAVTRLWDTFEHPDRSDDWDLAVVTLLQENRENPRFAAVLAVVAARASERFAERAIRLLSELAPGRVPATILERLAEHVDRSWTAVRWLLALKRGLRPGRCLDRVQADPADPEFEETTRDRKWSGLNYASTLDHLAEQLLNLEEEFTFDLPAAAATLLDGDATRWSELWRRAQTGEVTPAEIDEIRAIVDVRSEDHPGQVLARLIWRLRLPAMALLEQDVAVSVLASVRRGATPHEKLSEVLRNAFDDPAALRAFMAEFGLRDSLLGPIASLDDLRYHATDLILRRNCTAEVLARMLERGLLTPEDMHAWS